MGNTKSFMMIAFVSGILWISIAVLTKSFAYAAGWATVTIIFVAIHLIHSHRKVKPAPIEERNEVAVTETTQYYKEMREKFRHETVTSLLSIMRHTCNLLDTKFYREGIVSDFDVDYVKALSDELIDRLTLTSI